MPQRHTIGMIIGLVRLFSFCQSIAVDVIRKVLANQGHVGMGLKCYFQCQVAGNSSHNFADMPVFNIRAAVGAKIADGVGKRAGRGMKAKRYGTQCAAAGVPDLNITINGFGNTNNLHAVGKHFLSQKRCIGIGIVPADNHQGIQPKAPAGFPR